MRIDRLYISCYKNLIDFRIDFDETSPRQVLVGRNGVGKSNLLEALAWIFRDLDLEEESKFGYEIEYLCNQHLIKINCSQSNTKECENNPLIPPVFKRKFWIDSKHESVGKDVPCKYLPLSEGEFFRFNRPVNHQSNPDRLLPLYVFGYYSGVIPRFDDIFTRHEEIYYKEQITGQEAPLRPMFLAKPIHSLFALLSFYATNDSIVNKFLENELQILGVDSILFSLREPYWWASNTANKDRENRGDPRFWFAGGKVAPFLDSLFTKAFAPMSGEERIRISLGQEKTKERRYCFLPDQASLKELAKELSNKEFFARLESLVFSDLVDRNGADIKIWIRLKGTKKTATFHDLSEGERQLLTVLGLMRFTAEKEALFLLDEPDTHLNPAWCLDYLDNLRTYGAEPPNSQIIMTTHSPLTFAGMDKNEVVIMERIAENKIIAEHPTSSPKGMGFAAIITSDFFGLRSTLDKETLKKIDDKRELALKPDKTDDDRKKLEQMNTELAKLDFNQAVRDPLYSEFIKAITAVSNDNPALNEPAPSTEIWRIRKEIAKDIAKRLLKENSKP
jgi:predicted ATPase